MFIGIGMGIVADGQGAAIGPSLDYAFLNAPNLAAAARIGPTPTFARASSATYRDSSGIIQTALTNVARFNHTAAGVALGLLIEEARTNNLLWNRDWTNAAYGTVTNVTAAIDATGMDGVANSASTLTAGAANGVIRQSITLGSAERTFTVNVKRKTGTGTIEVTDDGGSNYTDITSSLATDSWFRASLTRTQANPDVGFRIVTSGDEIEVDFGQVEDGAVATSEIATTTAAVTRARDRCSTADVGWYNQLGGSFLIYYRRLTGSGAGQRFILAVYTSGSDRIELVAWDDDSSVRSVCRAGGVEQWSLFPTASNGAGSDDKVAFAYQENDVAAVVNGGTVQTDTSASIAPVSNAVFGTDTGGNNGLNGHIRAIKYWNIRQPNAFLQSITT